MLLQRLERVRRIKMSVSTIGRLKQAVILEGKIEAKISELDLVDKHKWTMERLHEIITKSPGECEGVDLYLQDCWRRNQAGSIFYLTGLDVSSMLTGPEIPLFKPPDIRVVYVD